jgi:hypothetical protein
MPSHTLGPRGTLESCSSSRKSTSRLGTSVANSRAWVRRPERDQRDHFQRPHRDGDPDPDPDPDEQSTHATLRLATD